MKKLTVLFILFIALTGQVNSQIHLSVSPANISCFGGRNGAVSTNVSGGTSPYTYLWSTGATTSSISSLAAGYYVVTVTDATSATASNNATLTEPTALTLSLTPSVYNTVNNISCPSCCNGYINISAGGGTTAYSYAWSSSIVGYSSTNANISNLCKGIYILTVTDANGCTITDGETMSEPDKDTWTMTGNGGSNASTHFIGTTDNRDFVFKTNNSEALRIKANGNVKINSLASSYSYGQMLVDSTGQLLRVNPDDSTAAYNAVTAWVLGGNAISNGGQEYLGTKTQRPLVFKTWAYNTTSGGERMRITYDGKVGIGTDSPGRQFEIAHNTPSGDGGMILRNLSSSNKNSEIKFYQTSTALWSIGSSVAHNNTRNFFIYDNYVNSGSGATRFYIDADGRVGIGVTPPTTWNGGVEYLLYVENGIKTRDVKVTASAWPDYIFEKNYKPMNIYELDQFIKQNKHLPGIPSAKEIEKNEGYELGAMVQKLLQKTEEQSLYIIDLQKQVDRLNKKIEKLSEK